MDHVDEFEQIVLGGILDDPDQLAVVYDLLPNGDYFATQRNRVVYDTILLLVNGDKPVSYVTVMEALGDEVQASYLAELESGGTSVNLLYYAQRVRDAAVERQIKNNLMRAVEEIEEKKRAPLAVIDNVVQQFYKLRVSRREPFVDMANLGTDVLKGLEKPELIRKVSTGLLDVDKRIGEIQVPSFWVIAGRPSMGKSALACNIAFNAAHKGARVAIVTLETSPKSIYIRELARRAGIENRRLQRGELYGTDFPTVVSASSSMQGLPLWILQDPTNNWPDIRMLLRYECRKRAIDLVIVDYIQLMKDDSERWGSGYQEAKNISGGLKNFGKEEDVGIICVSQLNRQVEMRTDKRPRMSDLREDGTLEQHADVVCLVYRDNYYKPETEEKWAELNFDKNKDGRTGMVKTYYDEAHCDFKPYDEKGQGEDVWEGDITDPYWKR